MVTGPTSLAGGVQENVMVLVEKARLCSMNWTGPLAEQPALPLVLPFSQMTMLLGAGGEGAGLAAAGVAVGAGGGLEAVDTGARIGDGEGQGLRFAGRVGGAVGGGQGDAASTAVERGTGMTAGPRAGLVAGSPGDPGVGAGGV